MLKLIHYLCGLKNIPCDLFHHIKYKLDGAGLKSMDQFDPCLSISENFICMVYVYDAFSSSEGKYINKAIKKLSGAELELKVEDFVAGFIGTHIN